MISEEENFIYFKEGEDIKKFTQLHGKYVRGRSQKEIDVEKSEANCLI